MKMKHLLTALIISLGFALPAQAAEDYDIDIKGQHAFIQFKVKHLGYSWLIGNFNTFNGSFHVDEAKPANNSININIDVASLDSNHALRDKHLRGAGFFDVATHPKASFVSTSYTDLGEGKGVLKGTLKLRGVSKDVAINVNQIGAGKDPWGGYRRGFEGSTTLHLSDYNMTDAAKIGPIAENVEMYFSFEGVRK
jgi:polyisoprenoid-binding protein YceI